MTTSDDRFAVLVAVRTVAVFGKVGSARNTDPYVRRTVAIG